MRELLDLAARWYKAADRFQGDPHHYDLGFYCGQQWHRLAARLKNEHGVSIYR